MSGLIGGNTGCKLNRFRFPYRSDKLRLILPVHLPQ